MPDASFHLTLAFLGEVEAQRAKALVDWVETLEVTPGQWRLDTWGYFRGPRILWVGGQSPNPALTTLHERLWDDLKGFDLTKRPERFLPHVSLLRRAETLDTTGLPDFCLEWSYNRLILIHSTNHSTIQEGSSARYTTLARSMSH
jgi:2'-5' RNA ligase